MTKCEWANEHCENYGYLHEGEDRYFCAEHYEAIQKIHKQFNRGFKKAGLPEPFDTREPK